MVVPGHAALFLLASLPLTLVAARISSLRWWHFAAFALILIIEQKLLLAILPNLTKGIETQNLVNEFVQNNGTIGIVSSLMMYAFMSVVILIALILKERRNRLLIYRIVDSEDQWNQVYDFLISQQATAGISEFRWRLLRNRCFVYIAEIADHIEACALLVSVDPHEVFISDFVFVNGTIGRQLLAALFTRPEITVADTIHFVSRSQTTASHCESVLHQWLTTYFADKITLHDGQAALHRLRDVSPDGSALRPFADARQIASLQIH